MTKGERVRETLLLLDEHYPATSCYLDHKQPYELLMATILSAQCTDARVNVVTKELFRIYPSLEAFAMADILELEQAVRTTGFYRNKAKSLQGAAEKLLTDFNGTLPSSIEELTSLPGVGRKTANVVRTHIFQIPSVVVDTHVKRIANKWGFTKQQDPHKIEIELMRLLPKEHWSSFNTQVIGHGRAVCTARSPKCRGCFLLHICPSVV